MNGDAVVIDRSVATLNDVRSPTIVSSGRSMYVQGAATTEVEYGHPWVVDRRGHLEGDLRVEDLTVERDNTVEVGRHCRDVIESCANRQP